MLAQYQSTDYHPPIDFALLGEEMNFELARLRAGLDKLPAGEQARLQAWASQADNRDPKENPSYLDKLMASAGGAAARYREVISCIGQTVCFKESNRPFDRHGQIREMPLAKWQKWASKAQVEFRASLQTSVPGVHGYWLHSEILDAFDKANHERDTPAHQYAVDHI